MTKGTLEVQYFIHIYIHTCKTYIHLFYFVKNIDFKITFI